MTAVFKGGVRLVALLFLLYASYAFRAFVLNSDDLVDRRYVDQDSVTFMDELIANGSIAWTGRGAVLDTAARNRLGEAKVRRAQRLLNGVEKAHQSLQFDPRFVSVAHPRVTYGRNDALRGRILDRHERILAGVDENGARLYPLGPAAYHVVGYGGGLYPKSGLEGVFDASLQADGAPWWRLFWRGDRSLGADLRLTIDADVQKKAFEALAGRTGAVVVLDPRNGDILAMVSSPSFDPNLPPGKAWDRAALDTKQPMLNRAIAGRYPPGYVFKLVVAAAGLRAGEAPVMELPRRDAALGIGDRKAFGRTDFDKALAGSSNVYFARWGVALGPRLAEMCDAFGFMKPFTLAHCSDGTKLEAVPSLSFFLSPLKDAVPSAFTDLDFRRNPRLVAQGSIGQNIVLTTPLQMAMVAGSFAYGGVVMSPRIVSATGDAPEFLSKPVSATAVDRIVRAMCAVIDEGTAKSLKKIRKTSEGYSLSSDNDVKRIRVAAKTGTAEVQGQSSHAWFVCFAPDEPATPVVCVLVENAGYGASNAGPVGMEVLTATLNAMDKERLHELSDDI